MLFVHHDIDLIRIWYLPIQPYLDPVDAPAKERRGNVLAALPSGTT